MKFLTVLSIAVLALATIPAQSPSPGLSPSNAPPLDRVVAHYDLVNLSLADGMAELSRNPDVDLHLGVEEVLRERFATPLDRSVRFSLHLENKRIRDILDALCAGDARYSWSVDGLTINVFPKARAHDETDLLNFRIGQLRLVELRDPDHALKPLTELFPSEQIGWQQGGIGSNAYSEPWTVTFENVTVRQFANRLAEHMGLRTAWIWQGGKDGRVFSFFRGSYNTL